MYCTNCGKENPDSNKFCLQCGQTLAKTTPADPGPVGGQAASASPPRRPAGRMPLILGGLLLVGVLAAAAWFLAPRLAGGGGADRGGRDMLLAGLNSDDEFDLSVLRLGDDPKKAVVIADNVTQTSSVGLVFRDESFTLDLGWFLGDFLPGTNRLVTYYREGDKLQLMEYAVGAEAPTEILSGKDDGVNYGIYYTPGTRDLFLTEWGGSSVRCYVAAPGEEATRAARGDDCALTYDSEHILITDRNNDGEMTLTVTDRNGENEVVLLDDVAAASARTSADASHVAYMTEDGDGWAIVLRDDAGEELFRSSEFPEIKDYFFPGKSDTVYYIGANDDGEWELRSSSGGEPLATAPAMSVLPAPDGTALTVLRADEDGAGNVYALDLKTGESVEVASGDDLLMMISYDPSRIFVQEEMDGDLTLTAAGTSGENPVTLFRDSDYTLDRIYLAPDSDVALLALTNSEYLRSLYAAPLDGSGGFFVLEEWANIELLNRAGDTLLLVGQEDSGDDPVLYAVDLSPDAKPVELDDSADEYNQGVIAPDGRSAIYNAITDNDVNGITVRRMPLDGEGRPEDLYEGTALVAASWTNIEFDSQTSETGWQDAGELPTTAAIAGAELIISNQVYGGKIIEQSRFDLGGDIGSGYGEIYYFDGSQGQSVTFDVNGSSSIGSSTLDPVLYLLDANLSYVDGDDDGGSGTDARLSISLPRTGRYYLVIQDDSSGYSESYHYQLWMESP